MATKIIKNSKDFDHTSVSLKFYFDSIGVESKIYNDDDDIPTGEIIETPQKNCINTLAFKKPTQKGEFDSIHFGDYNADKLLELYRLGFQNNSNDFIWRIHTIHIYSDKRWPIHNYLGFVPYSSMCEVASKYRTFINFDMDQPWLGMTMQWMGLKSLNKKEYPEFTLEDLVKEMGL